VSEEQHVIPVGDLISHDETEDCPCGPQVTFLTGGKVVTHNSLDGRERSEDRCGPPRDTVPCEACGVSIAAPRWFCGRCAKDRREGRKP
jgi:hypothetical protein